MIEKQFKKAILLITVLVVGIFFGLINKAGADTNQVVPEKKPLSIELQTKINSIGEWLNERPEVINNWATTEWEEIKEFQKQGWEDGKDQLARNFQQIKSFFVDKKQN